jgi:hypothetical protein
MKYGRQIRLFLDELNLITIETGIGGSQYSYHDSHFSTFMHIDYIRFSMYYSVQKSQQQHPHRQAIYA